MHRTLVALIDCLVPAYQDTVSAKANLDDRGRQLNHIIGKSDRGAIRDQLVNGIVESIGSLFQLIKWLNNT